MRSNRRWIPGSVSCVLILGHAQASKNDIVEGISALQLVLMGLYEQSLKQTSHLDRHDVREARRDRKHGVDPLPRSQFERAKLLSDVAKIKEDDTWVRRP
jgi:hypothetical protein